MRELRVFTTTPAERGRRSHFDKPLSCASGLSGPEEFVRPRPFDALESILPFSLRRDRARLHLPGVTDQPIVMNIHGLHPRLHELFATVIALYLQRPGWSVHAFELSNRSGAFQIEQIIQGIEENAVMLVRGRPKSPEILFDLLQTGKTVITPSVWTYDFLSNPEKSDDLGYSSLNLDFSVLENLKQVYVAIGEYIRAGLSEVAGRNSTVAPSEEVLSRLSFEDLSNHVLGVYERLYDAHLKHAQEPPRARKIIAREPPLVGKGSG